MKKHSIHRVAAMGWALLFCLQAHVVFAQIEVPSILIQNFSRQVYQAGCQNWGITSSANGLLYVANNSGLLIFDGNSWTTYELPDQSPVLSVAIYRNTLFTGQANDFGYWTADCTGLYTYHSLKKLLPDAGRGNEAYRQLYVANDVLWLKSENQLLQYKDGELTRSFLHTGRDPFDQLANQEEYLISQLPAPLREELNNAVVTAITKLGESLLIGTRYNGLFGVNKDGNIEHYTVQNQLQDNNIHAIYGQDNKRVWVALDNGISLISLHAPVTLLEERSRVGKLIHASLFDGQLLLETNRGFFKQTATPNARFVLEPYSGIRPVRDSLPLILSDTLPSFRKLIAENKQIMWGLQDNSIFRIRISHISGAIESVKVYNEDDGITDPITDLAIVDDVVVLTSVNGVFRYDKVRDCFLLYDQLNTQLDVFAKGKMIVPAPDAHYWITRGNEAALFSIKDGDAQLKCRILFDNYDLNVVTREQRIIPLSDSLHLVSAMQGVLLINTRRLIENSLTQGIPLRITQIEYKDAAGIHYLPLAAKEIVLPPDFRELTVKAATSILAPIHQLSYRIEGISSDWSAWQQDGKISFLQLPAGKYELKIRKYVVKGPFPEISLLINVRPPWYDTFWAYVCYLLLLWGIVQGGLRYYLKMQRKKEDEAHEASLLLEQQKIHQEKHVTLEAELQDKANELTLQTSALVRKNQAMRALLEELERQKELLGDRYPNKLYTKMKSLIDGNLNDQADWLLFESYFNSAHRHFIERLRARHNDLTVGDLRICCLLRMNLSTKEIASMLNVSVRSIELRRYRLRKRLGLEGEDNLVEFLLTY